MTSILKPRTILVTLLALGVLVGGALLLAQYQRYEWTTDSHRALEAFESGTEAHSKLYLQEAVDHLEEALEHDPEFAAAKLLLLQILARQGGEADRLDELAQDLRRQDLERLNPRERALISIFQANIEHRSEEVQQILEAYLERHPDDPWLLNRRCSHLMMSGRDEAADDCLRRLIQLDPNQVQAQNLLAYAAMNRGEFAEAESRFEVYRYLAPDQPNPHDSMGELLMVTGRYAEAEEEFRQAVAKKPDFCPSWMNLANLDLLQGNAAAAREQLREVRRAGGCPPRDLDLLDCKVAVWSPALDERWRDAWEQARSCALFDVETAAVALRAAVAVVAAEGVAPEDRADPASPGGDPLSGLEALQEWMLEPGRVNRGWEAKQWLMEGHSSGLWHSALGEPEKAVPPLRDIADNLAWGGGFGIFRLLTAQELAAALNAAGRSGEAVELRRELAAANRPFATDPPLPPLHPLPPVPPLPTMP